MDDGGNALFIRPNAEPLAQSDRRIHDSAGPAIDKAMGRLCGIRRRFSGTRRDAPVYSIWNCAETRKTATAAVGFPCWRGLNLGRGESFHWRRLLVPLPGISSRVTTSGLSMALPIGILDQVLIGSHHWPETGLRKVGC